MATTLAAARKRYFEENNFGEDGGYSSRHVLVRIFKLPVAFPNTAARVKAVRFHDLHHVLTGYATDFRGECEIAAWELGSDCANHPAALVLNLLALGHGVCVWPKRMLQAFARGRATGNLYRESFDEALLSREVEQVREQLGLNEEIRARPGDLAVLAVQGAAGVALNLALLAVFPLPLLGVVGGALLANPCPRRRTTD